MKMEDNKVIERLKSILNEFEAAYYGGFRATTDEEDHEAIREAIRKLLGNDDIVR